VGDCGGLWGNAGDDQGLRVTAGDYCCYEIWILEERAGKMKKDKEAKEGTAVYSEDSCLAYFSI